MSIVYQLPANTRPFITQTVFIAPLTLVGGVLVYEFPQATQHATVIRQINPASVYLLSTMSVGGDLDASEYLNAISIVPLLTLEYGSNNSAILEQPFSIGGLTDASEIGVWVRSQSGGQSVTASINSGRLKQTASLVGRTAVSLSFSFTVFAVDEELYNRTMRDAAAMTATGARR